MKNIMKVWTTLLESKFERFPDLSKAVIEEMTKLLNERHIVAQNHLKTYVEIQSSYIKTIQMYFNQEMYKLIKENSLSKNDLLAEADGKLNDVQKTQCSVVRQLVQKYFDIARSAFQDYCPKAVAHTMIYHIERHMHSRLVSIHLYMGSSTKYARP